MHATAPGFLATNTLIWFKFSNPFTMQQSM
jgi:hypothetical protein